jgi:class 3 adenylate cyclase
VKRVCPNESDARLAAIPAADAAVPSRLMVVAAMSDPIAVSRRLVAVFAADVEGYSRLMGADEVGTLKGLTQRRAILDRIIGEHRGRIANRAILILLKSASPCAELRHAANACYKLSFAHSWSLKGDTCNGGNSSCGLLVAQPFGR